MRHACCPTSALAAPTAVHIKATIPLLHQVPPSSPSPAFRSPISRSLTSSPFNLYHVPKVIRSDPRCRLDCVASRGAVRGHSSLYGTLREFTPPVWPSHTDHKYILVRRINFGLCRRLRREQQGRRPRRRDRRLVRHDRRLAHRSKGPQPCCLEYVPPSFSHS